MPKSIWARGISRLSRSWGKYMFYRTAAGVLNTAPLPVNGNSPLFLSQVCHRDITAYLIAIKSVYLRVGQGRILIIDDGSLTDEDISILKHHIPGIGVLDIASIDTGTCPRGGTWERLIKIIALTADHYVIQIDADTLVSGPIPEVVRCWRENKSFLLGTGSGQSVAPAPATARLAQKWLANGSRITVGTLAEAALGTLPDARAQRYVHASSGFAGFAKGTFRLSDLEAFSACMRERLGVRWNELGSEQIASNYMLANATDAMVLPLSRYASFEPHLAPGDRPFLHFFGTYRYNDGLYRMRAGRFLAEYSCAFADVPMRSEKLQNR